MMFTVPYKIPKFITSPINVMTRIFTSLYFMLVMVPLVFYMIHAITREREMGLRKHMIQNGLNPLLNFFAWLIHYTLLNVVITLVYVVSMKTVIFQEDLIPSAPINDLCNNKSHSNNAPSNPADELAPGRRELILGRLRRR